MKQHFQSATGVTTNTPEETSVVSSAASPVDEVYAMPATQGQVRFWVAGSDAPREPRVEYAADVAVSRQAKCGPAGHGFYSGGATT